MPFVEQIGYWLETQGCGTVGVDIFSGRLVDAPAQAIGVIEYPGAPGEYVHDRIGVNIDKPSAQILVRAASYSEAQALAQVAYLALDVNNQLITVPPSDSARYLSISPMHPPFLLQRDQNDLPVFAFSIQTMRSA